MMTYLALHVLGLSARWLPPSVGYRLAGMLGYLTYCLSPRARHNVEQNLNIVLGKDVSPKLLTVTAREAFRTAALNYYDLFRVPRLKIDELRRILHVRGWEHFDEAFAAGKGAIGVTPHLGNLDVVAHVTLTKAVRCTIPTEQLRPKRLLDLFTRLRGSRGLTIVPLDGGPAAARAVYQALRRNQLVAIVGDRDIVGNGQPVSFFGHAARLPSGPVALALRTGATLHAVRSLRRRDGSFELFITPKLDLPRTGDVERDLQLGTQLVADALETFIREAPGQWVVFEKVWCDDLQPVSTLTGGAALRDAKSRRAKSAPGRA